jgi:hypothetical protein
MIVLSVKDKDLTPLPRKGVAAHGCNPFFRFSIEAAYFSALDQSKGKTALFDVIMS